jgi:hypothetical protein
MSPARQHILRARTLIEHYSLVEQALTKSNELTKSPVSQA